MKIVAYTVIFNNRDPFRELKYTNSSIKYYLFTDDISIKSSTYEVVYLDLHSYTSRMKARSLKCLPHKYLPDHDYSIWFDASMEPKVNLSEIIDILGDNSIGAFLHSKKRDLNLIANNCILHEWDYPKVIRKQFDRYLSEGFCLKFPTYETGVVVRKKNEGTINLNKLWWKEIVENSERDQISFPYCLWKLNENCVGLNPGNVYHNPWFNFNWHTPTTPKTIKFI